MANNRYYVYILTNFTNKVLYTGVTGNIDRRIYEHKNKLLKGFTSKYNLNKIVFIQSFNNPNEAISAEKRIKGWLRIKKVKLVEKNNPYWDDLSGSV